MVPGISTLAYVVALPPESEKAFVLIVLLIMVMANE